MASLTLPSLPVPHSELVKYLDENIGTTMAELLEPYRRYEAELRRLYAQQPSHPLLADPYINVLRLFTEDTHLIRMRARYLPGESQEERDCYIMPLSDSQRRRTRQLATVGSLEGFQRNFFIFTESSLYGFDWRNVVAAGSSVVNCLLPAPSGYDDWAPIRTYYHEQFCPTSDVNLFLYGLTERQAIRKIRRIENHVRKSVHAETITVRTKHAITICTQLYNASWLPRLISDR